jgi:hypothetical protein
MTGIKRGSSIVLNASTERSPTPWNEYRQRQEWEKELPMGAPPRQILSA